MPKTSSPPRLRVVAPPPPLPDPRPPVPQIPITVADDPRLPEPDRMIVRAASEFLASKRIATRGRSIAGKLPMSGPATFVMS